MRPSPRWPSLLLLLPLLWSCGSEGEPSNPVPTATSLARDTVTAGSASVTIIIHGDDFVDGAIATFDGMGRTTTFQNSGSVVLTPDPTDIDDVGDHTIRVVNPAPGGGESGPLTVHVLAPPAAPTVDSLAPDSVASGGAAFTIHVHGTGFTLRSVIRWNGTPLPTTRIDATHMTANITAASTATPGVVSIQAYTPAPGGGFASRNLTITP